MTSVKNSKEYNGPTLIAVSGSGLGPNARPAHTPPELAEITNAVRIDDSFHGEPTLAMRVVLRSMPISARLPVAISDGEYRTFKDEQFYPRLSKNFMEHGKKNKDQNHPPIATYPIFGYARRNLIQWGGKIVVYSARMTLEAVENIPHGKNLTADFLRDLHNRGIARLVLQKNFVNRIAECDQLFEPVTQARLFYGLNRAYSSGEYRDLITEKNLVNLVGLVPISDGDKIIGTKTDTQYGSTLPGGFVKPTIRAFGFAVVSQGSCLPNFASKDAWSCLPVTLPGFSFSRTHEGSGVHKGNYEKVDQLAVALSAKYHAGQLTPIVIKRFNLAFEHVFAHVILLLNLKNFLDEWTIELIDKMTNELGIEKSRSFIRAWRNFAKEIEPKWVLGVDDPMIDPAIVQKIGESLQLNRLWDSERMRMGQLLNMATVLANGECLHERNNHRY